MSLLLTSQNYCPAAPSSISITPALLKNKMVNDSCGAPPCIPRRGSSSPVHLCLSVFSSHWRCERLSLSQLTALWHETARRLPSSQFDLPVVSWNRLLKLQRTIAPSSSLLKGQRVGFRWSYWQKCFTVTQRNTETQSGWPMAFFDKDAWTWDKFQAQI